MKTYLVTGNLYFLEHAPGKEFVADLPPDQERRAIARGAIKVIGGARGANPKKVGRPKRRR